MICKQCGKKVNGKTGICSHCGTKKSKKWLFILIPIGVLLCICIAIFSTAEFNKEMSKAADYISAKDFENAKSILDSQLGTNGSQPKVYLIFSDYYLAQEEYMQAVDILEEGLRECSSDESIQEKLDKIKAEYADEIATQEEEKQKQEEAEKLKEEAEKTNKRKEKDAEKAGVSITAFEHMISACETINIKYDDISNINAKDNWSSGKRCSFDYKGCTFLVYFNKNETVSSIESGNIKFYENGQKKEDPNNRIITVEEKTQLKLWAEEHIKEILKSPSSAEFPGSFWSPLEDWSFSKNGNIYTVSSYVDSQNGFGAMIRSQFTITYEWKDGRGTVKSLIFDGKQLI